MKHFLLLFICGLGIVIVAPSCKKIDKYSDPNLISPSSWNPQLAAPIAFANFGVYDIVAATDSSDLVVINPITGEIALVYKGEVVSVTAEDIFTVPSISQQVSFSTTDLNVPSVPAFALTGTAQSTQITNFPVPNGVEFNTVNFKSGTIQLDFTSDLRHDIELKVTFPYFFKNGLPITVTLNGNYTSGAVTASGMVDLSDATANFTNGGSSVNTTVMTVQSTVTGTGEPIVGTEEIDLSVNLQNPAYRNATGYFGQQSVGAYADSVLIKIFNNATSGYFELTNPKVRLEMINSFGFPLEVALNNLQTINVNTGATLALSGYPNPVNILAPTILGDSKTTVVELNNSNTANISSIISPAPKYFYFEAEGTSNPNGPNANLNFIEDTSRFRINAELELPLEGFAYGFLVQDTIPFSFDEDISQIESVMFRTIINNGFPVDIDADFVFVDANYQPLFSLTNGFQLIVASGETNSVGEVIQVTEKLTDLNANRSQLPLLKQAKYVFIKANMETKNGQTGEVIKILDTYNIGVSVGMNVKLNLNL